MMPSCSGALRLRRALRRSSCGRVDRLQFPGFLSGQRPDLDQVERADEPVADAETAGPGDRVAERNGPVMLQQDQRGGGFVGNVANAACLRVSAASMAPHRFRTRPVYE